MRKIPLYKGREEKKRVVAFAVIDDEDFDLVAPFTWTLRTKTRGKVLKKYAFGRVQLPGGEQKWMSMHRFIRKPEHRRQIDHHDVNGLNNIQQNLRECSNAENCFNRQKFHGTSKYKGVSWDKKRCKWSAAIKFHGHSYKLGRYACEKEAALMYDVAAQILFGEFARLNRV